MLETQRYLQRLADARIPYVVALTGSAARGEFRNNTGNFDYTSDTDVLCIIDSNDTAKALSCKAGITQHVPLILMSSEAMKYPSNAVLSIAFDSLINNTLGLTKPSFSEVSTGAFIAYQMQPLAYYASLLRTSPIEVKRRLYSKIAVTCLKLFFLTRNTHKRSFIFESDLLAQPMGGKEAVMVRNIINRALSDEVLQRTAEQLQAKILCCERLVESANCLVSTKLYLCGKTKFEAEIREAVFLENNRLLRSEAIF